MSSFSLHIATDNAAFFAHGSPAPMARAMELARILRRTADELENGYEEKTVHDINGNACGRYFWTDRYAVTDDAAALDRIANEITSNENFAPKAVFELLERIVDRMRLTGRDNADSYPDYDDTDERDEIEPRGDYGPEEIDAQHIRDAGRSHLI